MSNYWIERQAKAQNTLTDRGIAATEEQLKKYYSHTMKTVIRLFELTYSRVAESAINMGREPTPADLYKLDAYWKLQGELAHELEKLGTKQAKLYSRNFMEEWQTIYKNVALPNGSPFTHIDTEQAQKMINAIWCADGKSWKQRIWTNTEKLQAALNEGLTESVIAGVNPDKLKARLMEDFNVSYGRADALVRTEMAHIQTTAAEQRYKDAGVKKVQVWAKEDERLCEICGDKHEKEITIGSGEQMPPFHTKCRCCIVPVIDDKEEKPKKTINKKPLNSLGQEIQFDDKLDTEKWKETKEILLELTNEYDTRLTKIVIGGAQNAAGTVDMGGLMRLNTTDKATTIHEFAHTIAFEALSKYGVVDNKAFWKEIAAVRRAYRKNVGDNSNNWISTYEHSNKALDEFFAEAFTHAKLYEMDIDKPSKYGDDYTYSHQVLDITNKYFKKPI